MFSRIAWGFVHRDSSVRPQTPQSPMFFLILVHRQYLCGDCSILCSQHPRHSLVDCIKCCSQHPRHSLVDCTKCCSQHPKVKCVKLQGTVLFRLLLLHLMSRAQQCSHQETRLDWLRWGYVVHTPDTRWCSLYERSSQLSVPRIAVLETSDVYDVYDVPVCSVYLFVDSQRS